jgi:hypothetical protein
MAHRQADGGRPAIRAVTGSGLAELIPDPDRPGAWTLLVDGAPQSHVDLGDPAYLKFDYMRRIGHLIDLAAPPGEPLRVLHLGGGALTLARYVGATRPGSRQLAAESDAALADLIRRELPVRQPTSQSARQGAGRIRVRAADARAVLEAVRPGSFDVVIADVFTGGATPAHLTTTEFTAAARRALGPAGMYIANIAARPPLADAQSRAAAAGAAFPRLCLLADTAVLRGRRPGNLVLAAAGRDLPAEALRRLAAGDTLPWQVVCGADLRRLIAGARPATDALAPAPSATPEESSS